MILSESELAFWKENGFIKLTSLLTDTQKEKLPTWSSELESWPESPGKWMKYFESTQHNARQLCRVENFLQYHPAFNDIATGPKSTQLLDELMGEKSVLFKEKINFKFSGANGFLPHQDYPAFLSFGQTFHITMMVAIDDCTLENGCLQVVTGGQYKNQILPQSDDKTISPETVRELIWTPIECKSGDVLLFDSFLPHYSEANNSPLSRRALFLTYNRLADGGSKREAYYTDKRENFPPECERVAGKDYSAGAALYNVANPINNEVRQ